MCVPCVVRSVPLSQLVVSARCIIVMNVLMSTLVGNKLFISHLHEQHTLMLKFSISRYSMLCREGLRPTAADLGASLGEGKPGVKVGIVNTKVAPRAHARRTPPHGILPQSGHRGRSFTNGWPIVVFW